MTQVLLTLCLSPAACLRLPSSPASQVMSRSHLDRPIFLQLAIISKARGQSRGVERKDQRKEAGSLNGRGKNGAEISDQSSPCDIFSLEYLEEKCSIPKNVTTLLTAFPLDNLRAPP